MKNQNRIQEIKHNALWIGKLLLELKGQQKSSDQQLIDFSVNADENAEMEYYQSQGIIENERYAEMEDDQSNIPTKLSIMPNTEHNIPTKSSRLKNQLFQRCQTKERFDKKRIDPQNKEQQLQQQQQQQPSQLMERGSQCTLTIFNEDNAQSPRQTSFQELYTQHQKNDNSTSKRSVLTKNKSSSVSRSQCEQQVSEISKIQSSMQKTIGAIEEESFQISANLIQELQYNNNNNEVIPKYYKQFSSFVNMLQPEEIFSKYTQLSHKPSIDSKSLSYNPASINAVLPAVNSQSANNNNYNTNTVINTNGNTFVNINAINDYEEYKNQQQYTTQSGVFDEKYQAIQKGFPSDSTNPANEIGNQGERQTYSLSKISHQPTVLSQPMPLQQQKILIQKISKMFQLDNNLINQLKNTQIIPQKQQTKSLFIKNFDSVQQYTFYFPNNNYEKIIKKYQYYQYRISRQAKQEKKKAQQKRRNNFCIASETPNNVSQSFFLQFLQQSTKRKAQLDSNLYKPTNLSYGVALLKTKQYPIQYQSCQQNL